MPTTLEAIYENGVLKPLGPLALDEGTLVEVTVTAREQLSPGQRAYRMIAAVAALPLEVDGDDTSGQDHDRLLYGDQETR